MTTNASRREFMRRAALLAGAGAATPLALNLAALGSAAAQASTNDYKALVCIFLYGGNDHHNTIVPVDDSTWAQYNAIRTGIALPQADLLPTELLPDNPWDDGRTAGRRMAFNPAMSALRSTFDQGHLALAMNVGTLVRPITDYATTPGSDLPPKLFSHNDQQSVWQSSLAEGATSGWGGRIADLMAEGNGGASSFTGISTAGNAVFMSGKQVVPYQISPTAGAVAVKPVFGSQASTDAMLRIMQRSSGNLFESGHAALAQRSIALQGTISQALADPGIQPEWFTELDTAVAAGNGLAAQLRMVAKLIAARGQLNGMKRQVFFVSLGGFDHHDFLATRQPPLLKALADAMSAFYACTERMAMPNQVTTFTGSDFGRTLTSNGDGSDHGWGTYNLVMGGAVQGRCWYGQLPLMSLAKGDDPVGSGRMVPKIGVETYGATLGRWFGASEDQLNLVFPNLQRMDSRDAGFMKV
jgi:uncharacterized protein (DUF1501 family)